MWADVYVCLRASESSALLWCCSLQCCGSRVHTFAIPLPATSSARFLPYGRNRTADLSVGFVPSRCMLGWHPRFRRTACLSVFLYNVKRNGFTRSLAVCSSMLVLQYLQRLSQLLRGLKPLEKWQKKICPRRVHAQGFFGWKRQI